MNKLDVKDLYTNLYEVAKEKESIDEIIVEVADRLDITTSQLISALIKLEIDASSLYNSYLDLMKE